MSRIGATLSGFERYFLTQLARANQAAIENSIRLTTGNKINFPSDDPSAFMLISDFENRLEIVKSTKAQVEVAATIGAQLQLTLDEVRTQLGTIRDMLIGSIEGTLDAGVDAQSEIDTAVEQISALAQTDVNGKRFLDGSVDYLVSGRNSSQVTDVDVISLRGNSVAGSVTTAATRASVEYSGGGGSEINSGDATFVLTGERGSATISVVDNESLSDVRDRINAESHNTGITASVSGNILTFTSVDYGADAIVNINVTSGTFNTIGTPQGTDAVASINGVTISSNDVDGNRVTYSQNGTHVVVQFAAGFTGTFSTMTISDGPVAKFALTPDLNRITQLGLPSIAAAHLGGVSGTLDQLATGGSLSGLGSNAYEAVRVVDEALAQLTYIEGQVNGFADVAVASAADLLDGFITTLEDALDDVNETNEDEEELLLAKNETLATNAIAAMAILQQQRDSILDLIEDLAGF